MSDDAPATKRDLDELRQATKTDLANLRLELTREIWHSAAHVANVIMEHNRMLIAAIDEEAHAANTNIHAPAPLTPPKRARRAPR